MEDEEENDFEAYLAGLEADDETQEEGVDEDNINGTCSNAKVYVFFLNFIQVNVLV